MITIILVAWVPDGLKPSPLYICKWSWNLWIPFPSATMSLSTKDQIVTVTAYYTEPLYEKVISVPAGCSHGEIHDTIRDRNSDSKWCSDPWASKSRPYVHDCFWWVFFVSFIPPRKVSKGFEAPETNTTTSADKPIFAFIHTAPSSAGNVLKGGDEVNLSWKLHTSTLIQEQL
jgi:hypothetical protein